jgi:hypothetical protein
VRADLDSIFRDYDIEDKATLPVRVNLQQAAGQNQLALETIKSILKLSEKPTDSLEPKVAIKPALQAAIETSNTRGPAFEQAYLNIFVRHGTRFCWTWCGMRREAPSQGSPVYDRAALVG